jgi:hypothetical protein
MGLVVKPYCHDRSAGAGAGSFSRTDGQPASGSSGLTMRSRPTATRCDKQTGETPATHKYTGSAGKHYAPLASNARSGRGDQAV